jgi:REP element-mobilizing transposase RayT
VTEEWKRSEKLRARILLDAWIVMPNHVHGIVCIVPPGTQDVSPRGYDLQIGADPTRSKDAPVQGEGTTRASSLPQGRRFALGPPAESLSAMVGAFKSAASRRVNQCRETAEDTIWQSRFHDRIIRNEREWRARRRYIERNPERWEQDPYCA